MLNCGSLPVTASPAHWVSQMETWRSLSLSQLINLLFLIHGDAGCTGNFSVSFAAALELVGADLIWHEPETEKVVAVAQFVQ